LVVANVPDRCADQQHPSEQYRATTTGSVASARFWNMELWMVLLLLATALLLVEWTVFTRRLTG
jgi:hypothetical protein